MAHEEDFHPSDTDNPYYANYDIECLTRERIAQELSSPAVNFSPARVSQWIRKGWLPPLRTFHLNLSKKKSIVKGYTLAAWQGAIAQLHILYHNGGLKCEDDLRDNIEGLLEQTCRRTGLGPLELIEAGKGESPDIPADGSSEAKLTPILTDLIEEFNERKKAGGLKEVDSETLVTMITRVATVLSKNKGLGAIEPVGPKPTMSRNKGAKLLAQSKERNAFDNEGDDNGEGRV